MNQILTIKLQNPLTFHSTLMYSDFQLLLGAIYQSKLSRKQKSLKIFC
jgi:hypothetical protein